MTDHSSEKHILEHLGELRQRLIWVLVVFVVTLVIGFIYAEPMINHLKQDPAAEGIPWNVFSLGDPLRVYLQFAFVISLVFTTPFAMFQLWRFVKPGLKPNERKATLFYIPLAFFQLVIGLLFAYYIIFPFVVQFISVIADRIGAQEMYGISQYFGFMFRLVVPVALVFELPVVVMFLTRLRLLTPEVLRKARRVAYVVLVVIAVLITPPDFASDILVAIPLILLYEVSIWLSALTYRKIQREDERLQKEL